jgi:hypothetical protein
MSQYVEKLRSAIKNFSKESALKLSNELHEFEKGGGRLTIQEDRLWQTLTIKIESTS